MKQRNQRKVRAKTRNKMRAKTHSAKTIERRYRQMFTPHPLPFQGLYTDDDSLEQPSELKYVPTMSTPNVEA
ncbi:MAG: hypothetical protein ABSB14_14325 [Candidatus Sulfotelmatobacter sp.]|jgi:hypothetical protein